MRCSSSRVRTPIISYSPNLLEEGVFSEVAPANVSVHTIYASSKEGSKPCGNKCSLGLRS
jgi:hypothetical protein